MDPILSALLQSWNWRADVILVLAGAGLLYSRGWRQVRHRRPRGKPRPATGWRLAAYLCGLALAGLALLSPIEVLAAQFFYMHMVQHLLLVMLVPPLLLLANPLPFMLWGLPLPARQKVARLLAPNAGFRQGVRAVTPPGVVWMAFIAVFLGWHDPNAYNAALRFDWVHDLEHLTFFGAALLFWWHVTGVGPRFHKRFGRMARIAYVLVTVPVNMLTGVAITFSARPIYTYYTTVPRPGSLTVIEDQMLGGLIMWIPGSMMYLVAALVLVAGLVQNQARKPPLPAAPWPASEAIPAPGWKQ